MGPARLWWVRHGESAGNVAAAAATAAGLPTIEIAGRDVDVPLSAVGERQAHALGRWFARQAKADRPTAIWTSPYRRAQATAEIIAGVMGLDGAALTVDERLREKELGALNRLTKVGISARFPEEVERRRLLGKLYYRPPGGESWCDVLLRLRAVLDALAQSDAGARVLVVSHQVIVTCARYVLEKLDEQRLLLIDREQPVPNCSVTAYDLAQADGGAPVQPTLTNFVAPLDEAGAPVTLEADAARALK